ncbi:MAG: hypothetical protein JOZ24_08325 [Candidatus Eremiobacteraeota bacterium]|nr:hypothetical protein [Candidatus Eremiobacteraeota bacterium]
MNAFPERPADRREPLIAALVVSLLIHLLGGGVWGLWGHRIAVSAAKLFPRPSPPPEEVALSDAITIEKRVIPRVARRSPPPARPQPRRLAAAPAEPHVATPTLAPLPSTAPTAEPTMRAAHATIHRPAGAARRERIVAYQPYGQQAPVQGRSAHSVFSPEQMAAMNAQFSRTIAQAQRALTDIPPPKQKPTTSHRRYDLVMRGRRADLDSAQGTCDPLSTRYEGRYVWHIERCTFTYPDGFFENVTIPWEQRFLRSDDPVDHPGKLYSVQSPPDSFSLPHPFALSRLICIFYKDECAAVIAGEKAAGAQVP